jgi:hypothetical protein
VKSKPPSSRVTTNRRQVTPILRDQPDPGRGSDNGGKRLMDQTKQRAAAKRKQHNRAEVPIVPTNTKEENPRAERVTFDPKSQLPPLSAICSSARRHNFTSTLPRIPRDRSVEDEKHECRDQQDDLVDGPGNRSDADQDEPPQGARNAPIRRQETHGANRPRDSALNSAQRQKELPKRRGSEAATSDGVHRSSAMNPK